MRMFRRLVLLVFVVGPELTRVFNRLKLDSAFIRYEFTMTRYDEVLTYQGFIDSLLQL